MTTPNPFEEIERAFDTLGGGLGTDLTGIAVDVVDEGDEFVVRADLPGYDSDDIDVTLQNRRLTIQAERETEAEAGDETFVTRERRRQSTSRTVQLPDPVEPDATANYDRGVLSVRLEKQADADGTDIPVN
ncbi:Hsp20/alpha crystallin family protein [Halomicrobium urmianum]|uniref:Hsp20/alpha crystallin family protein n=1 Tax=Halomicrobium urmianum TaxID=1586233 RepID=UPI001CDA3C43|nr:Hsp20/alpha crystallin family protein [Halomicrobium urmianum]